MDKQLTAEEVLNAKRITCFDNKIIYVALENSNEVYGFSRERGCWFYESDYRERCNSEKKMGAISVHDALRMIHCWKCDHAENIRLNKAICFATEKHAGQYRKGTKIPYITHPLEVMNILLRMGADTDLLIAGLLHDTVEDTETTIEEIVSHFGKEVGELVSHHTEDKSKSWMERKSHTIESLKTADIQVKKLVMADKLSNLRSIAADYAEIGEDLWERFNAPPEAQSWYYSEIQDVLVCMEGVPKAEEAYWEMVARYKDVFVRYFLDEENGRLYQVSRHGENVVLNRGDSWWRPTGETSFERIHQLPRYIAERLEDIWNEMGISDAQTIMS